MKKFVVVALCSLLVLASVGCSTWTRQQKGAAIGVSAGGVLGGLIGHKAGNTAVGAILGAAVGGAAGAYIGNYMDKQAAEMEQDLAGAKIERVGEGIKVTFDSGLLFDVDKSTLRTASQEQLSKLAVILNKYPDTSILLEGHTDSTGTAEHNLQLSRSRSDSVASYLTSLGVNPARFSITGYGEDQPIAANSTIEGRQANRRVEVAIFANDKLKEVAKSKATG
ncbi:MAG: OmpA family protein [Candidatus Eisenbacteria bacterium]|nr:OmpA family protein [Candidatus Eisenbacteria bacterium]